MSKMNHEELDVLVHTPCTLMIGGLNLDAPDLINMVGMLINIIRDWKGEEPITKRKEISQGGMGVNLDKDNNKYITVNGEKYRRGKY